MKTVVASVIIVVLIALGWSVCSNLRRAQTRDDQRHSQPAQQSGGITVCSPGFDNNTIYAVVDHWGYKRVVFATRFAGVLECVQIESKDGASIVLYSDSSVFVGAFPGRFSHEAFEWPVWAMRFADTLAEANIRSTSHNPLLSTSQPEAAGMRKVTVLTATSQPTFLVPRNWTAIQIDKEVENRFGRNNWFGGD